MVQHSSLALLVMVLVLTSVQAEFNRVSCRLCVQQDATYCVSVGNALCRGDTDDQANICVSSEMALESRLDCAFASDQGDVGIIIAIVMIFIVVPLLIGMTKCVYDAHVHTRDSATNVKPTPESSVPKSVESTSLPEEFLQVSNQPIHESPLADGDPPVLQTSRDSVDLEAVDKSVASL